MTRSVLTHPDPDLGSLDDRVHMRHAECCFGRDDEVAVAGSDREHAATFRQRKRR